LSFDVRAQPQAVEHTLAWSAFYGGEYDDNDVLVAKFDRRGQLVWHTFLGTMDPNTPKTIGTAHTPLRWTRRAAGPVM